MRTLILLIAALLAECLIPAGLARAAGPVPGDFVVVLGSDDFAPAAQSRGFDAEGEPAFDNVMLESAAYGHPVNLAVAVAPNGDYVIAWVQVRDQFLGKQVRLRGYAADGTPRFKEMIAGPASTGEQDSPDIAMAADGSFVVVWSDRPTEGDPNQIKAHGYFADGRERFGEQTVYAIEGPVESAELGKPAVAVAPDGDFVVVWQDDRDGNGAFQIIARGFSADGSERFDDVTVNSVGAGQQFLPAIAMDSNGRFVVAWEDDQDGNGVFQILARGFNANGSERFSDRTVNSVSAGQQRAPAIAMDSDGRFVVAWEDDQDGNDVFQILARGFNANGSERFSDLTVNSVATGQQRAPSIAMDSDGAFVVAWEDDQEQDGDAQTLVRGFHNDGTGSFGDRKISSESVKKETGPDIAMTPTGEFIAVWESETDEYVEGRYEIMAHGYNSDAQSRFGDLTVNTEAAGRRFVPEVAAATNGDFVVVWLDSRGSIEDLEFDVLVRGYHADGSVRFEEITVNFATSGTQGAPAIAMAPNGDFVVAWEDDSDDDGAYDISVRGFRRDGTQRFDEMTVPAKDARSQRAPDIAIRSNGDFVVVWQEETGQVGQRQVWARGFNADGSERFDVVGLGTQESDDQIQPSIAMTPEGIFVVAWAELDSSAGSGHLIRAQGFNPNGVARFADFSLDAQESVQQFGADVDIAPNGDFVVVWEDDSSGAYIFNVKARAFTVDGIGRFGPLTVNSSIVTASPAVAIARDGSFVVVWRQDRRVRVIDSVGLYEIRARRFKANGTEVFGEMTVTTRRTENQSHPALAITRMRQTHLPYVRGSSPP